MDNVRVARELLRLAKSLVSSGLKPGNYPDAVVRFIFSNTLKERAVKVTKVEGDGAWIGGKRYFVRERKNTWVLSPLGAKPSSEIWIYK